MARVKISRRAFLSLRATLLSARFVARGNSIDLGEEVNASFQTFVKRLLAAEGVFASLGLTRGGSLLTSVRRSMPRFKLFCEAFVCRCGRFLLRSV